MKFDAETLQMFLKDEPFFQSKDCFCLGNSLEEAGEIISQIVNSKNCERGTDNVGMDIE